MTKKIFALQFFSILLIFVLPPILAQNGPKGALDLAKFSWTALPSLLLALLLFFQDKAERGKSAKANESAETKDRLETVEAAAAKSDDTLETNGRQERVEPPPKTLSRQKSASLFKAFQLSGNALLAFGLLLAEAALIRLASLALGCGAQEGAILPNSAAGFLACAATLASAAFYEEALYRLYLPKAAKKAVENKKKRASFEHALRSACRRLVRAGAPLAGLGRGFERALCRRGLASLLCQVKEPLAATGRALGLQRLRAPYVDVKEKVQGQKARGRQKAVN